MDTTARAVHQLLGLPPTSFAPLASRKRDLVKEVGQRVSALRTLVARNVCSPDGVAPVVLVALRNAVHVEALQSTAVTKLPGRVELARPVWINGEKLFTWEARPPDKQPDDYLRLEGEVPGKQRDVFILLPFHPSEWLHPREKRLAGLDLRCLDGVRASRTSCSRWVLPEKADYLLVPLLQRCSAS